MIYRIVETDNTGSDYPDESFVEPIALIRSIDNAQKIADILNSEAGENSRRYWKVEEFGYELKPGFEP